LHKVDKTYNKEVTMFRKSITFALLFVLLASCASYTPEPNPTITATISYTPTQVPSSTPTSVPTATPFGGSDAPRIAVFTEDLGPDEKAAGYIRIGNIDPDKTKITFGNIKLNVGTKPGNLPDYFEHLPPDIRWSPNGTYLAYTWAENGKAIIYIYDYAVQKIKWELELTDKNFEHTFENGMEWSADSNWLYIMVDRKSHYILDVNNGTINNLASNQIQGLAWHASQPLLFFENFGGTSFYQYDPVENQISQIEPMKFDSTKFENISSYDSYGHFDQNNSGYLFSTLNKDNSRSIYLGTMDDPIFELLRIDGNVTRNELHVDKIIPSPDKSSYLIGGESNSPFNKTYRSFNTSLSLNAKSPLVITKIDSANGTYPFSWSPDGKSYIGYQYFLETGVPTNPDSIVKIVIIDAEKNSVVKSYEINRFKTNSIYGYVLNTSLFDSSGPTGVDVYWR
jgi:hypothetical protein